MKLDFEPTCRYDHGPLKNVTSMVGTDFALGRVNHTTEPVCMDTDQFFSVQIFVCPTCGYIELFDGDIEDTVKFIEDSA